MLTATQLAAYREHGFAVGGELLDGAELARLRACMDAKIAALPPGQRSENMPSLHYADRYLRELFLSRPFVDVAEQILGPDLALFTVYAISKRPRDGMPVIWHQDAAYFPIAPMATFTLWLAVDGSTRENGCMQVIAGSHRGRRLRSHHVETAGGTTLPIGLDTLPPAAIVDVEVPAGAFSVHDPYLLHGSPPNNSDHRRCGITIKYVSSRVTLDRGFVSPTGFDWRNLRLYHARGDRGALDYEN